MQYYLDSLNHLDIDKLLGSLRSLAATTGGLEAIGAATVLALKFIEYGGVIKTKEIKRIADMIAIEDQNEVRKLLFKLLNCGILVEFDTGYYLPEVVRNSVGPIEDQSVKRSHDRKKRARDKRLKEFEKNIVNSWDAELGEGEIEWQS